MHEESRVRGRGGSGSKEETRFKDGTTRGGAKECRRDGEENESNSRNGGGRGTRKGRGRGGNQERERGGRKKEKNSEKR
eukprot:3923759-Pleurochrysis_carterae.AAC.1